MFCFGIDIGGTTIKIGAFENKNLVIKWQIPTNINDNGISIFKDIAKSIKDFMDIREIKIENVLGFGFGIPGNVVNNYINFCPNAKIKNLDIVKEFSKYFPNKKIVSDNDATLAVLGENEDKYSSCILVTLGTGVGGGVLVNRKLVSGSHGAGGEIGHIIIDDYYKFKCTCGLNGCLETLCSSKGILNLYNYYLKSFENVMPINGAISAKKVFENAIGGDDLSNKVIDIAINYLGKALAMFAVLIDPEIIIIGGGLSNIGDFLLNKIRISYKLYAHYAVKDTKIILATLRNDAGIYGAMKLLN